MGYLLQEALKALCGVNQWSYAVFWKIGCQNPKLLIWEECYRHGTLSCPDAPHCSTTGNRGINLQKPEGYQNAAQVEELGGDRVRLLMDKMMVSNHVNMVGQGLVGRAAFTGNHQWIVSGSYNEKAHPTEVANEIHLQFSAGMQTVVVIPVVPHGVVQLGSPLAIMENVGFVHEARSLILQVGCVPSAFVSDNYVSKNAAGMFGLPIADFTSVPINLHGNPNGMSHSTIVPGSFHLQRNSSQALRLVNHSSNSLLTQFQDNLQVNVSTFRMPNLTQDSCRSQDSNCEAKISPLVDSSVPPNGLVERKISEGAVMPLKSSSLTNHPTSIYPRSSAIFTQPATNCGDSTLLKEPISSQKEQPEANHEISTISSNIPTSLFKANEAHYASLQVCHTNLSGTSNFTGLNCQNGQSSRRSAGANLMFHDADPSVKELLGLLNTVDQFNSSMSAGVLNPENFIIDNGHIVKHISGKLQNSDAHENLKMPSKTQEHMLPCNFIPDGLCYGNQMPSSKDHVSEGNFFQSTAGDDLFDVLGVDFKNKLLSGSDSKLHCQFGADTKNTIKDPAGSMNLQNLGSQICTDYEGISESGVFSSSVSDHLLDAVISGVSSASRQISDDNVSCRTTVSKISSSSVPSTPHSNPLVCGQVSMSDCMQGKPLGISKPILRLGEPLGSSVVSGCVKKDGGNCSVTSSAYGSQISSWVEQGPTASVSTANSKKPDEVGKSNRKRLKPGENPRPRPKDRQMIQDRVKELREIVPNGAKCSIDALLERTIKHMLFLQSVTKHAEKLKQTVESKITNKEGGMLLNEVGATWAFELGSQSMVCPIVVEDLNPPRQLLIEMLCEERGLFLEVADIIRGLGLTILKGVMEARNDKIWARFAVEANRDVTRMEVFISLVHLLEQTFKGSTSGNGRSDENMALHPSPIPAEQQLVG